jgi:hypothetical protein
MGGAMERLRGRFPGLRQRDPYEWRVHVAHVRGEIAARLGHLESTPGPAVAEVA